jgi:hypothetical protein
MLQQRNLEKVTKFHISHKIQEMDKSQLALWEKLSKETMARDKIFSIARYKLKNRPIINLELLISPVAMIGFMQLLKHWIIELLWLINIALGRANCH